MKSPPRASAPASGIFRGVALLRASTDELRGDSRGASFVVDNGAQLVDDCVFGPWRYTVARYHQLKRGTHHRRVLYWLWPRLSPGKTVSLILAFALADFARTNVSEQIMHENGRANPTSVAVASHLISLVLAVALTLAQEPESASRYILDWHVFWRFMIIALLFTAADVMTSETMFWGTTPEALATVGYVYLPMAALLSSVILRRTYGILEQLSLSMMTLAITAFIILHMRGLTGYDVLEDMGWDSFAVVCVASAFSALASILGERIYKRRIKRSRRNADIFEYSGFYVYKVHLDFAALVFAVLYWAFPFGARKERENTQQWFGQWDPWIAVVIACNILQAWFAGLVTQHCSTVSKSVIQTVTTILIAYIAHPLVGRSEFESGQVPGVLIATIVVISVMVFQTGRRNIIAIQDSIHGPSAVAAGGHLGLEASYSIAARHAGLIVFVVADSSRTLVQQQALRKSTITPLSLNLACFACGVALGSAMALQSHGLAGLRLAYSPGPVRKALAPAACFALASTLLSVAYAHGISPVLATVCGYIYMPASALASTWVLGKLYTWLEWLALAVLTLASVTFGFLQHSYASSGAGGAMYSEAVPVLLTVGSAFSSVLASLVAERLLQSERDLPFHIQKVRLDAGSLLATLSLLPVIGALSSRPQDAFWRERPLTQQCADACPSPSFGGAENTTCGAACGCECGSGVFVAWGNGVVFAALAINVAQSWFGGQVVKCFSTVYRAIAQSCSLLVIYFIGDPLLNPHATVHNWTLTLVVLIVPFSTGTFMVAASEMESLMKPGRSLNSSFARMSTSGSTLAAQLHIPQESLQADSKRPSCELENMSARNPSQAAASEQPPPTAQH